MASPTPVTLPATVELPDLVALDLANKPVKISIIGFNVTGERAVPVCWPIPPGPVYVRASGSFRLFDLSTGLATGTSYTSLNEVGK